MNEKQPENCTISENDTACDEIRRLGQPHRAYTRRKLGIIHVPCIIQKDFFDPKIHKELRKELRIQNISRMIEVNFEVREFEVAE